MTNLGNGAWPVVPAAFTNAGEPDRDAQRAVNEWYLSKGVPGLFAVSLSGEMYQLNETERLAQARWAVEDAAGRIPVVAGALPEGVADGDDPTVATIDAIQRTAETGVTSVVLISSLLVTPEDGDEVLTERLHRIIDATTVDLGLYECPIPYKRVLADEHLRLMASSDRFTFVKDTSHDVAVLARKAELTRGSRVRVYNAQAHSVVRSVRDGGHGFSGWVGNILPGLMGWLVEHAHDDDPQVLRVQRALSVAEAALGSNYPSSAKWTLRECFGVPILDVSRMSPNANLTPHTTQPLRDLIALLAEADLLELQP